MSQSEVLSFIELPPTTVADYDVTDDKSHSQMLTHDPQLLDDEPMETCGIAEPHQQIQPPCSISQSISNKKPTIDGEGHVCTKPSVNPFFNLLRLYRSLPEAKGKTAPQVAVEGARVWRAMSQAEKGPFQRLALEESKRRMSSREKIYKSTNDTKRRERRSYSRRSKEMTTRTSNRKTKLY